jgi:hypothetical protein
MATELLTNHRNVLEPGDSTKIIVNIDTCPVITKLYVESS